MDILCELVEVEGAADVTMHINLSPEMETFIKGKVANGFYGSATEVIRDAIRRMQAEEERVQAWSAAISKGDDELDQGEGIAYTSEVLDEMTEAARLARAENDEMTPVLRRRGHRRVHPRRQRAAHWLRHKLGSTASGTRRSLRLGLPGGRAIALGAVTPPDSRLVNV